MQPSTADFEETQAIQRAAHQRLHDIVDQVTASYTPEIMEEGFALFGQERMFKAMFQTNAMLIGVIELVLGLTPEEQKGQHPFELVSAVVEHHVKAARNADHFAAVIAELYVKAVGHDGPLQYLDNGSLDFEFWAFMREQADKHVDPSLMAEEILAVLGKTEAAAA
jgi:hypothetical protein